MLTEVWNRNGLYNKHYSEDTTPCNRRQNLSPELLSLCRVSYIYLTGRLVARRISEHVRVIRKQRRKIWSDISQRVRRSPDTSGISLDPTKRKFYLPYWVYINALFWIEEYPGNFNRRDGFTRFTQKEGNPTSFDFEKEILNTVSVYKSSKTGIQSTADLPLHRYIQLKDSDTTWMGKLFSQGLIT